MPQPVHLIICTHTDRHLGRTLLGASVQTCPPATVTVSCDGDDPAIQQVVGDAAERFNIEVMLVQRAHTGRSRSSQVRNNAVRALGHAQVRGGILVFLDGDCVPGPDLAATHAALCTPHRLVIGFRVDLSREQTEAFDEAALKSRRDPIVPTLDQHRALHERQRRYARQAMLRRFGLAKAHKPKLLSANFSVGLDDYLRVNGFDEEYEGYGQEDDDLGRRLYAAGCRPTIAVDRAIVYHQWHPTRAPGEWHESPNAARFFGGGPWRCVRGVESAVDQPAIQIAMSAAANIASDPGL